MCYSSHSYSEISHLMCTSYAVLTLWQSGGVHRNPSQAFFMLWRSFFILICVLHHNSIHVYKLIYSIFRNVTKICMFELSINSWFMNYLWSLTRQMDADEILVIKLLLSIYRTHWFLKHREIYQVVLLITVQN